MYAYLNSHVPHCQWMASLPAAAIPYVGATHTSEIPYVFSNGVGLPLPGGNCSFNSQENAISENIIAAWTAMAANGDPSAEGGLLWPEWNSTASLGLTIVNATSVDKLDYSVCAFWDAIDNQYLNFTSSSYVGNETNGTSGNGSAGDAQHSAGGRFETSVWGLTMVVGMAILSLATH